MTQTIEVNFENVNTLASQLRAAGAVLKVGKGRVENFVITVTKPPTLTSIEEILTYSEPQAKPSNLIEDVLRDTNEIIAFENVQRPSKIQAAVEDLSAFDDNDNIPF